MSTRNPLTTLLLCALLLAPAGAGAYPPARSDDEPAPRAELRRESGRATPDRVSMAAWHRRYRPLARPVKRALAELLRARRRYRPQQLGPECRNLRRAVRTFRRRARARDVFPVANAAADVALKRFYDHLGDAATACLDDRWGAMEGHLHRAARELRQARLVLRSYGVAP